VPSAQLLTVRGKPCNTGASDSFQKEQGSCGERLRTKWHIFLEPDRKVTQFVVAFSGGREDGDGLAKCPARHM
jgi:hypothetical protein